MSFTSHHIDLSHDNEDVIASDKAEPVRAHPDTAGDGSGDAAGDGADDVRSDLPVDEPVEGPVETHPDAPSDIPLDETTDFRALQRADSEHTESEQAKAEDTEDAEAAEKAEQDAMTPSHKPLMVTGAVLITLLTAVAIVVGLTTRSFAESSPPGKPTPNSTEEQGRQFENMNDGTDADEASEARGHGVKNHDGKNGPGLRAHGQASRRTWVNTKMVGHSHHEDHPNRSAAEAKRWQDGRMWRQSGVWAGAEKWEDARSTSWTEDRTRWPQRGGYGGAFITQDEYTKHYTERHDFRIGGKPKMKNGYAHFKHEGDRFVILDPYPATWDTKWHKTDDVFLEYDQGYYLHNRKQPGVALAVMVLE